MTLFNGYCPLLDQHIGEGMHIEIVAELFGFKVKDEVKTIKKEHHFESYEVMSLVCENCPNFLDE